MSAKFEPTQDSNLAPALINRERFLSDCDLSCPPKDAPKLTRGLHATVELGREHEESPKTKVERIRHSVQSATEEQFMASAPWLYRHQLGLPENASSKELVEKYIAEKVAGFKHQSLSSRRFALRLAGVSEKTMADVMADKPGSDKELAKVLLQKEKEFLRMPRGEDTSAEQYEQLEIGILRNDYRAHRDLKRILDFIRSGDEK